MLATLVLHGCTLLSDFDIQQCSESADCDLPEGDIRYCEDARCVPGCADNAHCLAFDPRRPLCDHPGGACVALLDETGTCRVASGYDARGWGPLSLQDTNVVGAIASTPRSSTWLSLALASTELEQARNSIALQQPPMLLVLCDGSTELVGPAMAHLLDSLGASSIISATNTAALKIVLENAATRSHAVVISPSGSSVSPSSVDWAGDTLWYLGTDYADALPVYEQILPRAVSVAKARAPAPDSIQIASIVGPDSEDQSLSDAVRERIQVDGLNYERLIIQERLLVLRIDSEDEAEPAPDLQRLLGYAPDLVLLFMGNREAPSQLDAASVVVQVEAQTAALGRAPPLYIMGPRSVEDVALQQLITERASLRSRILGVRSDPEFDSGALSDLRRRFAMVYPDVALQGRAFGVMPSVYEALYLLSYGLMAASGPRVEPSELLVGFERVTSGATGAPIDIGPGPERLGRGVPLLNDGENLGLRGVNGVYQFDASRHTRLGRPRLYSIDAAGMSIDMDPAVAFQNASTQPD
ncbi:MAG TPA: hypothetical protein VMG12_27615 [Polyangiaceae bacterium]|nr:hypothetical protein [Polyangiaceae bacterium]